ncbi:MAG: class I fructose-bisphosphate aldolase [Alphaproteobacteria bacterium]|nr:class I fructose-bisphosphate aldolase [Alphaproteobacteria bacterium]
MKLTRRVREILDNYEGETPGTKANLSRMLMAGRLGGTGRMVILPVDQGFEHGAARSFAVNPPAYDPHYHYQLAIDAGLNAYAAPLGSLAAGADTFAGAIPTILKMNSSNSLARQKEAPDQAVTASVDDALRLGCAAVGFTIYPASDSMFNQYEELREITREAKAKGLAVVVWSYPRGGDLSKDGELAVDIIAYGAHMAALLGANIIKVKLPSAHLENKDSKKVYEEKKIPIATMTERVQHIMQVCFNGRRIVVFSGGASKGQDSVLDDARAIYAGGGNGSIIGRNCFQRPRDAALKLLDDIIRIYQGKAAG